MKSSFTKFDKDEIKLLQYSILWVFTGVASIDRSIDYKEIHAFDITLKNFKEFSSSVFQNCLKLLYRNISHSLQEFEHDQRTIFAGLNETGLLLRNNLSSSEMNKIINDYLSFALIIGFASGRLLSAKLSEEEKMIIEEIANALGFSNEFHEKLPSLIEFAERLLKKI